MGKSSGLKNAPSTTGKPSGGRRGNNPPTPKSSGKANNTPAPKSSGKGKS